MQPPIRMASEVSRSVSSGPTTSGTNSCGRWISAEWGRVCTTPAMTPTGTAIPRGASASA